VLELRFGTAGRVEYRWKGDEAGFAMPIEVGDPQHWTKVTPTVEWNSMAWSGSKDDFHVATDFYYVGVTKE